MHLYGATSIFAIMLDQVYTPLESGNWEVVLPATATGEFGARSGVARLCSSDVVSCVDLFGARTALQLPGPVVRRGSYAQVEGDMHQCCAVPSSRAFS